MTCRRDWTACEGEAMHAFTVRRRWRYGVDGSADFWDFSLRYPYRDPRRSSVFSLDLKVPVVDILLSQCSSDQDSSTLVECVDVPMSSR
jgi:hypothetical protein